MDKRDRVYVAGHRGLVGSALTRALEARGYTNLLLRSRAELDLTSQSAVNSFFAAERPEYVFLAAAKVGGILANSSAGADFIRDNLLIQTHVIDASQRFGALKLLFLGSSCVYPKLARQPIHESELLTGLLEQTNEPYAIAKIAGIKMCEAYRAQHGLDAISLMPANLYGPNDNFDLAGSHVVPALIRKFHEAQMTQASEVVLWGTGAPLREFLHVDDMADAALFLMRTYSSAAIINVGSGQDIAIRDLAAMVSEIVGYRGAIVQDLSKPDGTPRKLLDVQRLGALGWRSRISLKEGIAATYRWYLEHL